MADKMKLTLVVFDREVNGKPRSYQVREVTGSVDYWPHQVLTRAEVSGLCAARGTYTVTIKPNKDVA